MSYITLGNLTRFLNKLKTYIGNNYLKLTGGTVSGETTFTKQITAPSIKFPTGLYPVRIAATDDLKLKKCYDTDEYIILDEDTYLDYVPDKTGSGAHGNWHINILGNALNDSEGNKIVDTYAKKSEIPTVNNITVDSALSATSTNPVQNKVIKAALTDITSNTVYATYVTAVSGLTIPGGKIWIA